VGWEAYVHWDRIGPTNPGAEEQYSFEKDTAALEVYLQRLSGTAITGAFMRYPESKDLPDQIGSVSVIKAVSSQATCKLLVGSSNRLVSDRLPVVAVPGFGSGATGHRCGAERRRGQRVDRVSV
jgi:hypothetical protein